MHILLLHKATTPVSLEVKSALPLYAKHFYQKTYIPPVTYTGELVKIKNKTEKKVKQNKTKTSQILNQISLPSQEYDLMAAELVALI